MKKSEIKRVDYYENSLITSVDDLIGAIPKIESLFRNSREYKHYIGSVREGLDLKNCAFFQDKDFTDVKLELHHIHDLFSIVLLVGSKEVCELEDGDFLTVYDLVRKVIEFHLKDYPIVMMLSSTVHQLYHSGQYQLPKKTKDLHLGDWKGFIKEYYEYINVEEIKQIYEYFDSIDNTKFEEYLEEIEKCQRDTEM